MLLLAALAYLAATLGAISGLGGGIFIMPLLVESFGGEYSAAGLATLSLSVVLLNALTSLSLGRQTRFVDWTFALPMAAVSVLGVALGVYLQRQVSRGSFELILGGFLFLLGIFILWRSSAADANVRPVNEPFRTLDGVFSFLVGSVASFFGVGGGVLQVPYMVYFRKRSVKQSTATSQVILASAGASSLFFFLVVLKTTAPWIAFVYMAPAVVAGGITGSRLAGRLRGPWIVRILAGVLLFLAYRISLH